MARREGPHFFFPRRRAQCYLQIMKPRSALADLKKVAALQPSNEQVKEQLASTQKLVKKIEFEKVSSVIQSKASEYRISKKAIGVSKERTEDVVERCRTIIKDGFVFRIQIWLDRSHASLGGCSISTTTYSGPQMAMEEGEYKITAEFIRDMLQWFKDGKLLPRRYVWEIIIGAYSKFQEEESLVSIDLNDGMTCDVIGDVHGRSPRRALS